MSITLDIARASMSLSEMKVKQAVDVSMMKKSMDLQEKQMESIIAGLSVVASMSGRIIDTKA